MTLFLNICGIIFLTLLVAALVYGFYYLKQQVDLDKNHILTLVDKNEKIYSENEQLLAEITKNNKHQEVVLYEMKKQCGWLIDKYDYLTWILQMGAKLQVGDQNDPKVKEVLEKYSSLMHLVHNTRNNLDKSYQEMFNVSRTEEKKHSEVMRPEQTKYSYMHKN